MYGDKKTGEKDNGRSNSLNTRVQLLASVKRGVVSHSLGERAKEAKNSQCNLVGFGESAIQ